MVTLVSKGFGLVLPLKRIQPLSIHPDASFIALMLLNKPQNRPTQFKN
jgi:hypothetical protein